MEKTYHPVHGHMMIVKLDLILAGVCMLKRKKKMPLMERYISLFKNLNGN